MTGTGYPELLWLTAPEIVVALTALLVLVLDLGPLRRSALAIRFRATNLVACIGCLLAMLVLLKFPAQGGLAAGMLVVNPLTQLMQIALLAIAILVLFLVNSARFTTHVGEYCALILFATTAMMLLVSTQNLLVIFVSIEFLSLSLYILTAFDKQQPGLGGGRTQIFPVWRHVRRHSALWHEPALRPVGLVSAGPDRNCGQDFAERSIVDLCHGHGVRGIRFQDCGCALSYVGSRGIPGGANVERGTGSIQF